MMFILFMNSRDTKNGLVFCYNEVNMMYSTYMQWKGHIFCHGSPLHPDICFVFDGPLQQWSDILPILNTFHVRAVFFIRQPISEKENDLLRDLLAAGHQCYAPVSHSDERVLTAISGHETVYQTIYAPQSRAGLKRRFWQGLNRRHPVVLWSLSWNVSRRKGKPLRFVRNGAIVRVMGRPTDVQQFATELQRLRRSGFRFCTLDELARRFQEEKAVMSASRSAVQQFVFYAWKRWESFLHGLLQMEYVCTSDGERTLFRVRKRRYYGHPLPLSEQEWLRRGDPIVELHLNNDMFAQVMHEARSTVQLAAMLIRRMGRSLPELSRYLAENPRYRDVKAVYGITLMYRGADPFGFSVAPLPRRLWTRLLTAYLRLYLSVVHPDGRQRLMLGREKLAPKRVYMSMAKLLTWYPPNPLKSDEPAPFPGHNMEREGERGGA